MAKRIITWRNAHGPFRTIDDLLKIKGIGKKTLSRLKPYISL
jgi:competence protein ComEA